MENLFNPWNLAALAAGVLPSPVDVDRPVQQVAIANVARFVALVLEDPGEFVGKRIEIASDELTTADAALTLSRVTGRRVAAQHVERESLSDGLVRLFDWLERVGDHVDVVALRAHHPAVGWLSFERWAERQDWRALARGPQAA
jgi:uncharacterized protein YbjT (DUF2867 family)